MYPDRELIRLAGYKAALQRDIALRRLECRALAVQVARPLEWLDRAVGFWRKVSPFAKVAALPLGLLVKRTVFPRIKVLRSLLRWGPLAFGAARGIRSMAKRPSREES
jgi:hypothetical protein